MCTPCTYRPQAGNFLPAHDATRTTSAAKPGGFRMFEYTQELAFDTDEPEFVRGFEAARVGAQLHATDDQVEATVHNTNAEMMLRLAELTHRNVHCVELDDTWMTVTFQPYEED